MQLQIDDENSVLISLDTLQMSLPPNENSQSVQIINRRTRKSEIVPLDIQWYFPTLSDLKSVQKFLQTNSKDGNITWQDVLHYNQEYLKGNIPAAFYHDEPIYKNDASIEKLIKLHDKGIFTFDGQSKECGEVINGRHLRLVITYLSKEYPKVLEWSDIRINKVKLKQETI
jgi:hypothetical protein